VGVAAYIFKETFRNLAHISDEPYLHVGVGVLDVVQSLPYRYLYPHLLHHLPNKAFDRALTRLDLPARKLPAQRVPARRKSLSEEKPSVLLYYGRGDLDDIVPTPLVML
jgi:hypothetical protein